MSYISGDSPHGIVDVGKATVDGRLFAEKRKQPGVSFPSASKQGYILIVRIDLKSSANGNISLVRNGLRKLCGFFERIYEGDVKIDLRNEEGDLRSSLSRFNFSSTIGFGIGFFEKLELGPKKRPRRLYSMPDHAELGDSVPYVFNQTDMIVQVCSTNDYVNRWVLKTDSYPMTSNDEKTQYSGPGKQSERIQDIITALQDWAFVTDLHSGFQRLDGRNLLGFVDGISQPNRLTNNVTWTTANEENESLVDGTYMAFQKIEHDLGLWEKLNVTEQEKWIGRSKGTGLLLGTLSRREDEKLAEACRSEDPRVANMARARLKRLLEEQKDPHRPFYDNSDPEYPQHPGRMSHLVTR